MRCLITGSAGYIGSALFRKLSSVPTNKVIGFDRSPSETTTKVCDLAETIPLNERVDIVYHLAGLYEKDYDRPPFFSIEDYIRDNVKTTERVLNYVKCNQCHIVFTSSLLISENPIPYSYYSKSKALAEKAILEAKSCSSVICRLPRVIGIPDDPNGTEFLKQNGLPCDIVSKFISEIIEKGVLKIYSGQLKRNYIHLNESIDCLQACCDFSGIFDARIYESISIKRIANILMELVKSSGLQLSIIQINPNVVQPVISNEVNVLIDKIVPHFPNCDELFRNVATKYFKANKKI